MTADDVRRGAHQLAEAVRTGQLNPVQRAALGEILAVLAVAEHLDATQTASLPTLAGQLAAVVDAYRSAARRVGGAR